MSQSVLPRSTIRLLAAGLFLGASGVLGFTAARSAHAADRVVLCEEFTSELCYGCSYAGPALSTLVDVYAGSFAFVQYHVDDDYVFPWSAARWTFYQGHGTPTAAFDGIDITAGAVSNVNQQYVIYRTNHFLPERATATDVTLTLSAEALGGSTYRVSAQVGIDTGGTAKTLRVYIVQVLDHWPAVKPYHRNGFKQAAPTQDVTLGPGQSQTVEATLTFDAESWADPGNIRIVAWVQAPGGSAPAQVYQAATRDWPLVSGPGDADGDAVLDATDNCPVRYNPGQADGDGDGRGDACDNCVGSLNADQADTDEDGFGDVCDNCPAMHFPDQVDSDGDGRGNACDACPDVGGPAGVDAAGRPLGGIDVDCDVDAADLALFVGCVAGPGGLTPPPGCDASAFTRSDTDQDGDADLADFGIVARNYTGPLVSPPMYVGAATCTGCHTENHTDWSGTIHATAFNTLVVGGHGDDYLCYPCHTVGYGAASGFVSLAATPQLANVQCENCHGPGSNHLTDPVAAPLQVSFDSTLCGSCHQSCHGLCGENHHPQFEQWSVSAHATALVDLQDAPDAADACLQCHSTEYRLAPEEAKPGLNDVTRNLECVACHDPHGGPNTGQLRLPTYQLCADCHTLGSAFPGETPKQPQKEMLHGTGGYSLDFIPLDGPHTEHWWGLADECVTCHVHMEPYGGPQQPVNSGHTFAANLRACGPCHTESVATALVAATREEIEARLAEIAPYFNPGHPLYVDPATLPPEQLTAYTVAKFNREFVQHDQSFGAHNGGYARALLSQTEAFLGIDPWFLRVPDPGARDLATLVPDVPYAPEAHP
jgi:predicted CXXCH cytochrome family protein